MTLSSQDQFDNHVYTSLEDAITLAKERFADTELKQRVVDYLGLDTISKIPYILHEPVAMSFRYIATPNLECEQFVATANQCGLRPVFFEYIDDLFTSNNQIKRALGKCYVHHGKGKHDGDILTHHTVIDFNTSNGKRISDIHTTEGQSLVAFHHQLFLRAYPQFADSLCDASPVFYAWGNEASQYYKKLLALFICFGVLFETYVAEDPVEQPFLENIFLPAFDEVEKLFGVRPIIVRVLPAEHAQSDQWYFYPEKYFTMPNNQ